MLRDADIEALAAMWLLLVIKAELGDVEGF
jgi:hypothetical protein